MWCFVHTQFDFTPSYVITDDFFDLIDLSDLVDLINFFNLTSLFAFHCYFRFTYAVMNQSDLI